MSKNLGGMGKIGGLCPWPQRRTATVIKFISPRGGAKTNEICHFSSMYVRYRVTYNTYNSHFHAGVDSYYCSFVRIPNLNTDYLYSILVLCMLTIRVAQNEDGGSSLRLFCLPGTCLRLAGVDSRWLETDPLDQKHTWDFTLATRTCL